MTATVLRGDARALPLADQSVDLVVTSPPYWSKRSYRDAGEHYHGQIGDEPIPATYVDSLLAATREVVRVLKPSGSLFINLDDTYQAYNRNRGPGGARTFGRGRATVLEPGLAGTVRNKSLHCLPWRYAIRCVDELGLILRAEIVWHKSNPTPESCTDRVHRTHETWLHFTTQPRYYANIDEVREPHLTVPGGPRRHNGWAFADTADHDRAGRGGDGSGHTDGHPLGKLPPSVRVVATDPLEVPAHLGDHYATMPVSWPLWIITGWCPPGGRVLDVFGGTGTTALAATALGRHGISVDYSADYCATAQWRVRDPNQRAKAVGVKRSDQARAADHLDMEPLFDLGEA